MTIFDLIFGTSTGAIIAALLSLGYSVSDIYALYKQHVPTVMRHNTAAGRTKALDNLALEVFGTVSMEQLRSILFNDIQTVRINDTFQQPELATDLLEADLAKLNLLYQRGWEPFASHEQR